MNPTSTFSQLGMIARRMTHVKDGRTMEHIGRTLEVMRIELLLLGV